jgi:hypothetical protein
MSVNTAGRAAGGHRLRRALTFGVAAALALVAAPPPASAARAAPAVKYYVVSSSYQGQPEFMYEIAQRFLGNGNRAADVFTLNKGRQEPDGATVSDPTVIRPGWFLELPDDAHGDGVVTGAIPTMHLDPSGTLVKYYWIADTYQNQPESLALIAQRFLGTQNRTQDVFALNKGRLEPGGGTLTDPAKLTPGWFVKLPADAQGDGLIAGPLPFLGPAPPGQPSAPAASGASGSSAAPTPATAGSAASSAPAKAPASTGSGKSGSGNALVLILAIVLPALVVAALVWWAISKGLMARLAARLRSGRSRKARVPASPRDEAAAWTIDRGLRTLATACAQAGRPLPGAVAVVVGTETITLHLGAPDERPPGGWSAEHQGRTWSAPLRLLQSAPVDDGLPAPYPRLVSAGDSDQGRVLLNLAEAHGVISLEGDGRLARPLAADWARELSGSPWSRGITVLRIGFGGSGSEGLPGAEHAASIDTATATEILDEAEAGVLLLGQTPGGRDLARVVALAVSPEARWSVVVVGSPKTASWRLVADASGTLDTGLLGEPVRLHGKRPLEHAW